MLSGELMEGKKEGRREKERKIVRGREERKEKGEKERRGMEGRRERKKERKRLD